MSTQEPKLSSNDDDWKPESERRRAFPCPPELFPGENRRELTGFSGSCENTSLSDWIQLVQMNRRDAVIGIERPDGRQALFWCRDGDIIDASCDGATGEDAVYRALTWERGKVSVAFTPFERARRIPLATPALLLRAAVYLNDSNTHELEPALMPSDPAPGTPAEPTVAPPSPPLRAATFLEPAASASSPASANSPQSGRSAGSEGVAEPAAAGGERRRHHQVWGTGIVIGVFLLMGFTAARLTKPKDDASREGLSGKVTTHFAASRPELPVNRHSAASPVREESPSPRIEKVREESPSPRIEKAPARPLRSSGRTAGEAPTPRRVIAAPVTKAPPPAVPKSPGRAKPGPEIIAERAPRIQIIDERESKIEVIK